MNDILVADNLYWTLLTVNLIPLIISFVTNEVTKKGVKEGLLFILAGLAAFADEATAAGSFRFDDFVAQLATIFVGSAGFFFAWQRKTVAPSLERSGLSVGAPR